jgi:ribose/xylose/arabinose/galactoside ABC-type transport system permease subunit
VTTQSLEISIAARASHPTRDALIALIVGNPLLWLVLLITLIGMATSDYYLSAQNLQNLMRSMAVFGLLAMGMTLVLLTGRIDLSVGATMIFSIIAALQLMVLIGDVTHIKMVARGSSFVGPVTPFIALALVVGGFVGLVNGIGIAYGRIAPFIMTLATLTGLRGLNYVLTSGHPYYLQTPGYVWFGDALVFGVPISMLIYAVVFAVLAWVVGQTVIGQRLYAIGGEERTARYAGIPIERWVVLAYVVSGVCAAIAGVLFTARLKSVDAPLAAGYELTAIAIAVIGGTTLSGGRGSPWRTLCGGIVLAAGLNLLTLWGVSSWTQNIVVGIALIAAVALTEATRRRAARP